MKLLTVASSAKKLKNDPFGFIIDSLLAIIVNLVIPIPLAGTIVTQFKAPLLGLLATLIVFALFMLITVGTIVSLPFLAGTSVLQNISSIFQPNPLNIAPDLSFVATSIPRQNPFGGSGLSFSNITAYFYDPDYYFKFGKNHTGLDLIPSDEYFKSSKTYQDTKKVVIFATINGSVRHFIDQYGGETVEITNADNSLKVLYIHFGTVLVESGNVSPGTPVGIMGDTGFSTGEHVHYEVQMKDGINWLPINPLNYIQ